MSKKILVISTSLRKNSNSEALAAEFIKGAKEAGHNVDMITLVGKTIKFCKGCLACQKTQLCVIKDDAIDIAEKMRNSDVLVFATPIYYYEMAGQMKTMLDRANPLFSSDYSFRDVYMLSTASDESSSTPKRALSGLQGWIDCFEKAQLVGSVFAGGVTAVRDIKGHKALREAFEMGKKV